MPPSVYSLATVNDSEPLLTQVTPDYGTTPISATFHNRSSSRRIIFNASLKMAAIFTLSTAILGGTLWLALPRVEEPLRIPKSFAELQAMNQLLKKYLHIYPFRILVCYIVVYLFLQAFSLPGSMYLSILGGALWGVPFALPLACTCVATGASLCYLLSAALGPLLLTVPRFATLLSTWQAKLSTPALRTNLVSFLIVLRIAPLPPHWVVNVLSPHVGIDLLPFFVSTWLGILGVTVIHTTIGRGLDDMTSADDFHLISWRNFFGLSAVVVGVMIPVGLRYWLGRSVQIDIVSDADEDAVLASAGPPMSKSCDTSDDDDLTDDDSDIILEAGPSTLSLKP